MRVLLIALLAALLTVGSVSAAAAPSERIAFPFVVKPIPKATSVYPLPQIRPDEADQPTAEVVE